MQNAGSILQYFRPSLSYHLLLRSVFCLVLNDRFTQVKLFCAQDAKVSFYSRLGSSSRYKLACTCADTEGDTGGPDPTSWNITIFFFGNTGPDPLENHKATKPAFNVEPSSARQQNAMQMVFRWRANYGSLLVVHVFGSSLLSSTKKKKDLVRV